ncbi:hypothetical protein [Actinocrispum wychmicini]|uniref:Peptidase S53 domain-containing protein n=1 Tax=Actinocrispum wychmicini TaxID=1213861 RepID=A0A4R2JUF6_9PSEU|nr:hypothetical protein [Actinocrispum wychmicini]TCO60659.1 hypothetical protein EV192_103234 [Actinocrispum wychmicini]
MRRVRLLSLVASALLLSGGVFAVADAAPAAPADQPLAVSDPGRAGRIATLTAALDRIKTAIAAGHPQWGAMDLRDIFAYQVDHLWTQGVDGFGTSVAVMEGWDLAGIQDTINQLDDTVGLPHTTVQTIYPNGPLPPQCPPGMVALHGYGSCDAWGGELRLDVEAVHLMAPYAKIVISATPSDSEVVGDTSSEVAMPEIVKGLEYISAHKLANTISISDGSSETDYSHGAAEIHAQDPGILAAAAAGIPVAVSTGDCGVTQNLSTATAQCQAPTPGPAIATWDDNPFTIALGGSRPQYTAPCPPCANPFPLDPIEGAGLSQIYQRPSYQDGVRSITGSRMRSIPDITMNSRHGTSQSAPMFAAVLAMATQLHGRNLGPVNEILYQDLARDPGRSGIVDVTTGNNNFRDIPGYSAGPGFDVASGWGTVDASRFVPAIAKAARHNRMADEAADQLADLRDTLSLTPSTRVTPTSLLSITSSGFLPGHPVKISIDGTVLTTITADTSGNIAYGFTPASKTIGAGQHTVSIDSMLLTQSKRFTVTQ